MSFGVLIHLSSPSRSPLQVNVAKDVMLKNMETMMIRQDKLDTMVDKSDGLLDAANQFQKAGGKLRSHMWWQVGHSCG